MTAPVYTPGSNGRMTMEEYGEGAFVTGEVVIHARRAFRQNPPGQLWERVAERAEARS